MRLQASIIMLALLASTTASADRKRRNPKATAKTHMDKASVASKEGRHEDALKELEAAYALDPQPNLLLARGHVYVKLEKCEEAIKLYEEYLATSPAQELADMATEALETCKATLAPPPAPEPPPPPTVVTSEALNADAENPTDVAAKRPALQDTGSDVDAPARRTWFKDPILLGLGAGGVLALGAGVVVYSSARGKLDDAEAAGSYEQWKALDDDAHKLRTYAIIGGAAGALLAGGAVFYYLRTYRSDEQPRVTVVPTQRGAIVGWAGRF